MRTVGTLLMVIGGIGFGMGFLCGLGIDLGIRDSFELPLGDLCGIVVDSRGNTHVGTQFYCRVQTYDAEGKYLYGKFTATNGGALRMKMNTDDQFEVATARKRRLYRFGPDGNLISVQPGNHSFHDFGEASETRYYDERDGTTYVARHGLMFPTVVKRTPDGREAAVITTPLHKWIFMGPFPAWIWVVLGACIRGVDRRWRRHKKKLNDASRGETVPDEGTNGT
jgi:hypothetical protein